jgi:hypothetical protein
MARPHRGFAGHRAGSPEHLFRAARPAIAAETAELAALPGRCGEARHRCPRRALNPADFRAFSAADRGE